MLRLCLLNSYVSSSLVHLLQFAFNILFHNSVCFLHLIFIVTHADKNTVLSNLLNRLVLYSFHLSLPVGFIFKFQSLTKERVWHKESIIEYTCMWESFRWKIPYQPCSKCFVRDHLVLYLSKDLSNVRVFGTNSSGLIFCNVWWGLHYLRTRTIFRRAVCISHCFACKVN